MKPLNALLAILGAAAVGVAIGILVAPRKGSETRESIIDFLKKHCPDLKGARLNEIADQLVDELDESE